MKLLKQPRKDQDNDKFSISVTRRELAIIESGMRCVAPAEMKRDLHKSISDRDVDHDDLDLILEPAKEILNGAA